jgi:hypothetical protein
VPPGAVRQIKVLTGPLSAQYGMSTTGVLSVVTASGSNVFYGDGVLLARPSGLQSRRRPCVRPIRRGGPAWRGAFDARIEDPWPRDRQEPFSLPPDEAVTRGDGDRVGGVRKSLNSGRRICMDLSGSSATAQGVESLNQARTSREKGTIVFRWEVCNVFNRPNVANPSSDVSSPSASGKMSAMSVNPPLMQFGLKFTS